MGEASRRGTYEERKSAAIERDKKIMRARSESEYRKPSPKHAQLMATIAGIAVASGVDVGKL